MKGNSLHKQIAVLCDLNYFIFLMFCSWTTWILSYIIILLFIVISVDCGQSVFVFLVAQRFGPC